MSLRIVNRQSPYLWDLQIFRGFFSAEAEYVETCDLCTHISIPEYSLFICRSRFPYRQSVGLCARARIPRGVFYNIKNNPQGPRSTLLSRLGINKNELNVFFFLRRCANAHVFFSLFLSRRECPYPFHSNFIQNTYEEHLVYLVAR